MNENSHNRRGEGMKKCTNREEKKTKNRWGRRNEAGKEGKEGRAKGGREEDEEEEEEEAKGKVKRRRMNSS